MTDIHKKKTGDYLHAVARAGLGAIPVAGAAATELLNLLITPPLEKRREKWMTEIGMILKKLEENKGIDLESLRDNDIFIDTVLVATQAALRTSEKGKIEYFKNVIINSALSEQPEQSLIQIFLNLIETFTIWHIKILKFFDDPKTWFHSNNRKISNYIYLGLSDILEDAYPELKVKADFYNLIWLDLSRAGLHNTGSLKGIISSSGLLVSRTTDLGKQFLDFISNPIENKK